MCKDSVLFRADTLEVVWEPLLLVVLVLVAVVANEIGLVVFGFGFVFVAGLCKIADTVSIEQTVLAVAVGTVVGTVVDTVVVVVVLAYIEAYTGPNTDAVLFWCFCFSDRFGVCFGFFAGLTHSQYSLALRDRMLFCLVY